MANPASRSNLFDDFFKEFAPGFFIKPLQGDPAAGAGQIRIDVAESDTGYTVQAELPGVPKEDIDVSIDGSVVTLRAEVKRQGVPEGADDKVLRSERHYGALSRSFQLPQDIDQAAAKARYDNGVLTLTLPKKRAGASQKLNID